MTLDRDWNKTLPAVHGPIQPWISTLAKNEDPYESFNELIDTPLDFSAFVVNRLKVDTLTLKLLAGLTFELMKALCKSLVELEYFLKDVCKATTDQLDWNNPKGQQYPHDLRKPLPLIPNSQGHRVIPFDHFINKDLTYLRGGVSSRTYATSVTKTKAADYGHIKWSEDLIPNLIWINRESARNVYSKNRIIGIKKLTIIEWHNYKHLEWITIRRYDDKLYTFKDGDYNRLRLQDIEDMLLLLVQGKLKNLNIKERLALGVSLRMFTRSIVIRMRVEDLQLGIKSYQKKLNLTIRYETDNLKRRQQERAGAMIQAFDRQLKHRRLMRSLEKFIDAPVIRTASAAAKPSQGDSSKFYLITGTPDDCIKVKEFQRSFRHSDTERLSRSDEELKLKNFKKDVALKLFKVDKSRKNTLAEYMILSGADNRPSMLYKDLYDS
ncbi:hypothetical protein Tco_0625855 [Tanacetum coccineum]|uniref:Uncharacterized protein n=1 Tax=Tanacetum coccineum TaxID=301880 RepID=A0ABQ4WI48_9ASTR